jgi:3-hydroxyacyl-CoA dehydrogenase
MSSANQPQSLRPDADAYVEQAERDCWTLPDLPASEEPRRVKAVGVVGAGTMGGGIAMNFLNAGMELTLVETSQENLDRGLATIRFNYGRAVKRGKMTNAEVDARLSLIKPALDLSALAEADLIIEAVFENMALKKDVFSRLDRIVKPGAVLATNTSYLNVDEIAGATSRPEDVIGMHFFSPANIMRLLEIVRGRKTAGDVVQTALDVARRIDKVGVVVGVCDGFVGNRLLFRRQAEALALVEEGVMPWAIDEALNRFGFRMGPFAMSDLAGLDIGWDKASSKGETLRDLLCEAGRFGQKNGKGYYDYDAERRPTASPQVEAIITAYTQRKSKPARELSVEDIQQRCLFPMINEGLKVLEEGIAVRASDIDVVWLNGFGWPRDKGGPMYYGDTVGPQRVLAVMETLLSERGVYMKPAVTLARLAESGGSFLDA